MKLRPARCWSLWSITRRKRLARSRPFSPSYGDNPSDRPLVPNRLHRTQLRWDDGRDEYAYADPLAYRLHRHYLRVARE